jgi:hypothetical protein
MLNNTLEHLVIIKPLEDITGKTSVQCQYEIVAGKLKNTLSRFVAQCTTNVFRYYYYGATIEIANIDADGNVYGAPRDVKIDDYKHFGIALSYALTFNNVSQEVLSTNGVVYRFSQSVFYRNHPDVVSNMYRAMMASTGFVLRLYTINGGIVYTEIHDNVLENSREYKYVIRPGFTVSDRNILKCLVPQSQEEYADSRELLKQEDIDKLFEKFGV